VFTALRHRDFRLLWTGQSISALGDSLLMVAIGLFVTRMTGDPRDVGVVLAAYSVPLVALILFGGVLADRLPRQRIMLLSDMVRCGLHTVLAVLVATGAVRIWHMVLIGVLFGSAQAVFQPAYTGLVPQTVPEQDIQAAQSLSGVSRELAEFASPALATLLVLGVGGGWAFGVDAASFAVSALLLARIHIPSTASSEPSTIRADLVEGWHALRERTWVWATVLCFSLSLFLAVAPFFTLGAAVARDVYGNEAVYGIASAFWGVGTVSGALLAGRWTPPRPMLTAMLCGAPFPLAVAAFGSGGPLPLVYAAQVLAGLGIGVFAVFWETALATRVPAHLLSRISAWDYMGSLALLPLGYLLAGPVGDALGVTETLVLGGVLGSLVLALGLLPRQTRGLTRGDALPVPPLPVLV
jgi:MFS family permease